MNILHVCLYSYFTEEMNYQENFLTNQNALDGHEVCVIADEQYYLDGKISRKQPEDKILASGVRLIRIPILKLFPGFLTDKLRIAPSLYKTISQFKPDVIFYHGVVGTGLLAVNKYKNNHPDTKIYIDSHEDFNNSGRTFISKWIQYKILTRAMLSFIRPKVSKFFYVSYECKAFLKENYNLSESEMEFFPLGGEIISRSAKENIRQTTRTELNIPQDSIVFLHSGKLEKEKKTQDILQAFARISDPTLRLLVAGNVPDSNLHILDLMKKDSRVIYLGWVKGDELINYICASDCYLQPGTQSATLQISICCGLPVMIHPYPSHVPYLKDNGYYVTSEEDIYNGMQCIVENVCIIKEMEEKSYQIAAELLDYKILSSRYCH